MKQRYYYFCLILKPAEYSEGKLRAIRGAEPLRTTMIKAKDMHALKKKVDKIGNRYEKLCFAEIEHMGEGYQPLWLWKANHQRWQFGKEETSS